MSKSQNTTAAQTLNLAVAQKQTEKIALQPGQAIKLMVDGQLYTGQKTIGGRGVRLVRKGDKLILEVEGQDQPLVEVSGFFPADSAAEQAATIEGVSAENLLGYLDPQGIFESGSSAQLAAADTVGAPAVSTPSWGTLIAQAASATATTTTATSATAATAATAAAAISPGAVAAVLVGAAVVINNANSDDTPAEETHTTISGAVNAGPVIAGHNLTVTIYDHEGNILASGVTVSPTGTFTADLGDYSGPIIAVLVDGDSDEDYVDEKTALPVDLSSNLMAATNVSSGASIKLNINPLTTAAAIRAGLSLTEEGELNFDEVQTADEFAAAALAANTGAAKAFNLGTADNLLSDDVVTTVNSEGESDLSNATNYGKALAIISAMDTTSDRTGTAGVINSLATGFDSDGAISPDLADSLNTAAGLVGVFAVNIVDANGTLSVSEIATNLAVYTAEYSVSLDGGAFSYALSGADAELFEVSAEGVISFKARPDHENAGDANADNVFNVILTVTATYTDEATTVTQTSTDSIALAITVTDAADVLPVFTSADAVTIAENSAVEVAVYTAVATPDVSGASVYYELSGPDAEVFSLDTGTGEVFFVGSPNHEEAIDVGQNNVYNITVTATTVSVSSTQEVAITVTNVNEAPTAEGAINGQTAVLNQTYTLNAGSYFADVDANDAGTYTLTVGTLPAGLSLSAAGVIGGTATATAASGSYTITRTDAGGLTATQTFTLSVVDKPSVLSFTVADTDATSPNTATKGNSGETLQFVVTLSEAVTSQDDIAAVFTINGVDVTATAAAVTTASDTITFTGTVPSTGNGSVITLKSLTGTITGDLSDQPLLAPTAGGISHSGYTVDNILPTITDAYNVAENTAFDDALKSVTLAADESVTWSGLAGADASAFILGTDANAGKLMFEGVTDQETKGSYTVTVTGTDDVGNATSQEVIVTVTNVNEAPTLSGVPSTPATAVVGQALALADFAVADVDSATVTVTLTATNGTIGGVEDADANTLGTQVTGTASAVNTALAGATFTAAGAGAASVGITVTDSSLSASSTYGLNAVTAPSLSTTLGGVNNLDARSNIVLTASENVTAVEGMLITITNTGGTGFHGENTVNSFTIEATDPRVMIDGNKITINPEFDLDLANNYTLSIEEGAFLGEASGEASVAFAPINFSTVAPMDAAGGIAGTLSQTMGTDGALAAGAYWLDLEDRSTPLGQALSTNAANKDFVFVAADYSRDTPPGSGDGVATDEFFVRLYNFGLGDMIYIDTLGDNSDASLSRANETLFSGSTTDSLSGAGTKWKGITFAGIVVGDGSAAGDTSGGGLGSTIRLSLEPSADTPSDHTVAVTYATLPTLLGTDIGNIYAVL